ncbi:MAG: hypothetical protein ACO3A4_11570 [Silvanigrellaceae bacterium]
MESSPTEYAQDELHCSIYPATNKKALKGTTKVLSETCIKSWHKKIKTGDTCYVTISPGQSNFTGILNRTNYFLRMTARADESNPGSIRSEPKFLGSLSDYLFSKFSALPDGKAEKYS